MRTTMNSRTWSAAALLLLAICAGGPARSDEGLWTLDQLEQLPLEKLREKGLAPSVRRLRDMSRAVVRIGYGGTGSFVSPEGLVLTNHHVAYQCISTNSRLDRNILEEGFLAASRADEIPCRGMELFLTQEVRDVTAEIQLAEDEALPAYERYKKREARRNQLATKCQGGRDDRRCQVTPFYGGAQERLIAYFVVRDVRLVHAPEEALANFGADIDNFEWPRHCADYAFLRAYAGPDNQPRAYDASNVPYKPERWFSPTFEGYTEGAFVMVMGFPGTTDRWQPAATLQKQIQNDLPSTLERNRARIAILRRRSAADPAVALQVTDQLRGLSNSEKAMVGRLDSLQRTRPLESRRALERDLRAWIDADDARKARFGDLFAEIDRLVAAESEDEVRRRVIDDLTRAPRSLDWARMFVERAAERAKPDDERRDPHHERQAAGLRMRIVESPVRLALAVEQDLLASVVERALQLPDDRRIAAVDRLAKGKKGTAAELARLVAREVFGGTKLDDREARRKYFEMNAGELERSGDTALAFVADLYREDRPRQDKMEREIKAPMEAALRRYAQALWEFKGQRLYPDANSTLRFTYGEVMSYWPAPRGARPPFATTIASMLATATNHPDYRIREEVFEQLPGPTLPALTDASLGVSLVNFVATTDIIGGNSGSPVLDGMGELIGLVFDSNYEALGDRYVYDAATNRTIAVDVRFIVDLLLRVYDADELAAEFGFEQ